MSIYAIGDLHLSFGKNKPMNVFGQSWENYEQRLELLWNENVKKDDIVLIPGDFSWATYLKETMQDFEYLNNLNGRKVLIKGNHDYWWTTLKKMKEFLNLNNFSNIEFIYNSSYECDEAIIVGTRGWLYNETENSEKMLKREVARLELSIKDAKKKNSNKKIICMMHYPPITQNMIEMKQKSEYLVLLKEYGITECIYGHLHGKAHNDSVEGNIDGINLRLVSSDYLKFKPIKIM